MKFDDWWASLTQAEQKMIGINNAAFVWNSAVEACAKVCEEVGNRDRDSHAWDAAVAIRARGQDPMPLFDDWPGGWKK
jgi:hypothetical protein